MWSEDPLGRRKRVAPRCCSVPGRWSRKPAESSGSSCRLSAINCEPPWGLGTAFLGPAGKHGENLPQRNSVVRGAGDPEIWF